MLSLMATWRGVDTGSGAKRPMAPSILEFVDPADQLQVSAPIFLVLDANILIRAVLDQMILECVIP